MSFLSVQINNLWLFLLATAGLTDIITQAGVFKWLREAETTYIKTSLFSCPRCMGWWAGLIMYVIFVLNLHFIAYPFAGSFICVTIYKLLKYLKP